MDDLKRGLRRVLIIFDQLTLIVYQGISLVDKVSHLGDRLEVECRARVESELGLLEKRGDASVGGPSVGCELQNGFQVTAATINDIQQTFIDKSSQEGSW